jgi:hypothetical protein
MGLACFHVRAVTQTMSHHFRGGSIVTSDTLTCFVWRMLPLFLLIIIRNLISAVGGDSWWFVDGLIGLSSLSSVEQGCCLR